VSPARFVRTVVAQEGGVVSGIDGWAIAGIARKAGAPTDLGAGVDLLATVGQYVEPGDGLFHIHGADEGLVSAAALLAQTTRTHDVCVESRNSAPLPSA
jgi:thymidine phosphorylase